MTIQSTVSLLWIVSFFETDVINSPKSLDQAESNKNGTNRKCFQLFAAIYFKLFIENMWTFILLYSPQIQTDITK